MASARLAAAGGTDEAVRRAIVEAVRSRMGAEADVRVEALHVKLLAPATAEGVSLAATPEPGARLGRPVRFSLAARGSGSARPAPAGYAVGAVYVAADHLRSARSLSRGETLVAEDVVETRSEVGAVLLQRLPKADDVMGSRVVRDVLADEVITRSLAVVRPLVKSGDAVAIRVETDGVMVQGHGVATQSGDAGDTIRVVNRDSRRSLKARIVAAGAVEVIQ